KGFKQFPNGKDCLYKIAIYFTILDNDIIPKQVEPNNNELSKLKLTSSIESNLKQIIEAIHVKFRWRPQQKKCKFDIEEENLSLVSSLAIEKEIIEEEILVDPRLDKTRFAKSWLKTSKQNLYLCNETEIVNIIKDFFKNIELEEKKDYIITNFKADEFNFEEFFGKNVTIGKMVIKKNSSNQQKKIEKIDPRVVTFARTIGSGKTTEAKLFEKYLKDKGYKVYRIIEVLMQVPKALKIFYETKNALFFQQVIINKYKQVIDKINEMDDYDYIIIDRGYKEIEIFTEINIKDKKTKNYLREQLGLIKLKHRNDIIYVRSEKKTAIKRKESRNRS
ncbi:3977_t:CDS:2, partial [Gigaspora margarita]